MGSNPIWSTMALDDEAIIEDLKEKVAEFAEVMGKFGHAFAQNFGNLKRDIQEIISEPVDRT